MLSKDFYTTPLRFATQNIGKVHIVTEGVTLTAKKLMKSFQPLSSETTVSSVPPLISY